MNWIFSKLVLAGMILGILAFPVWASQGKYEVTILEGMVAVRETDCQEIYFTQTSAHSLPPQDRELLKAGIRCDSREELYELLENFCS